MTGTATLRLFWIETRRSAGLWCFPFLVLLAWFAAGQEARSGVTLWTATSQQIAFALILAAPAAGGLAAWTAGRDRRRRIEDLLQTTPRPALQRDLAGLGASAAWTLAACLAVGISLGQVAFRNATWGGPLLPPIGVGLLTLLAGAAIGFVAGTLVPSRFAPPLVAVGLFLALAVPTAAPYSRSAETGLLIPSPLLYLSPVAITEEVAYPVFFRPWPDIAGGQALMLVGIAATSLSGLALLRRATPVAWAGLTVALATAGLGVVSLTTVGFHQGAAIPYVPACVQHPGSVEVCLHPAYESALETTAEVVDAVMAPLIGVPGGPRRVEQAADRGRPARGVDPAPEGTMRTFPIEADVGAQPYLAAQTVVLDLVRDRSARGGGAAGLGDAQAALAIWLLDRAGFDGRLEDVTLTADRSLVPPGSNPAGAEADAAARQRSAIDAAVARFAALDAAAQRAWLGANWADLRAGSLTLDDLP